MQNDTKQQLLDSLPDTVYNKPLFIKNLPANFDGPFDWLWMKGCFGDTIMPMDIDGMVERNGHFFAFETKGVGCMVPPPQQWTINALIKTRFFTVMVIWGDNAEDWTVYYHNGMSRSGNGKEDAKEILSSWYNFVNNKYNRDGSQKGK